MAEDPGKRNARACEGCRSRKIRCDREFPCANCRHFGIQCVSGNSQQESRPRIIVSAKYEQQIELIQKRLQNIEELISRVAVPGNSEASPVRPEGRQSPSIKPTEADTRAPSRPVIGFQGGGSSFSSTVLKAGNSVELTAKAQTRTSANPAVRAALSNVKATLKKNRIAVSSESLHFPGFRFGNEANRTEIPPVEFALAVVTELEANPTPAYLIMGWRDLHMLRELCQLVYSSSGTVSSGILCLFYGLLWEQSVHLFDRDSYDSAPPDWQRWSALCECNFCGTLETYELMTEPCLENIQALAFGAVKALEIPRPFLCRNLISAAVNMCTTLGYHRQSTLKGDFSLLADMKRHAFWTVYLMDKNASLNLGRAAHLQDFDIDADFFTPSIDPKYSCWDHFVLALMRFSRLEGRVYDVVYSPLALSQDVETRIAASHSLASDFEAWKMTYLDPIPVGAAAQSYPLPADFDAMLRTVVHIYYSVLTVLWQGTPSPPFLQPTGLTGGPKAGTTPNPACLECARQSLVNHLSSFPRFATRRPDRFLYTSWVLHYTSFAPFFAVFSHCLSYPNAADAALLSSVVDSLRSVAEMSERSARLYEVCHALWRVAELLLPAASSIPASTLATTTPTTTAMTTTTTTTTTTAMVGGTVDGGGGGRGHEPLGPMVSETVDPRSDKGLEDGFSGEPIFLTEEDLEGYGIFPNSWLDGLDTGLAMNLDMIPVGDDGAHTGQSS